MNFYALRRKVLLFFMATVFSSSAQNFEISSNVTDSLSPTSYLFHVSGYAAFTDSMVMEIELRTNDAVSTIVYSSYKDFGSGGLNTLINFVFDPLTEAFSLDIGTYPTRDYVIHIISKENGNLKEELLIETL